MWISRVTCRVIGVFRLVQDITPLRLMKAIFRSSFNIDNGPFLQVRDGGCGIVGQGGGSLERSDIRNTMQVVSSVRGQRKATGEDWVYMQDTHICCHQDGILNLGLECGEEDPGTGLIPARRAGWLLIMVRPGL